jgi:hypothetical protein
VYFESFDLEGELERLSHCSVIFKDRNTYLPFVVAWFGFTIAELAATSVVKMCEFRANALISLKS